MRRSLLLVLALLSACDRIPGTEANRIREAEQAVRKELLDPSAAQFRTVAKTKYGVCGEVNAKNQMGGYSGFRLFYVSEGEVGVEPDRMSSLDFETEHGQFMAGYVVACDLTRNRK